MNWSELASNVGTSAGNGPLREIGVPSALVLAHVLVSRGASGRVLERRR